MTGPHRDDSLSPPTRRRFDVLTTNSFIDELHQSLKAADRSIAIQLMTFDGDEAGQPVADLLVAAVRRGVDVRLLIDSFALRFVSDREATRPEVRAEFEATLAMYDRLQDEGVALRFTHPNGPFRIFSVARNHKKLFLVDDVAFVGGINVSDHNFAWHDFMVRLDDPTLCQALSDDFDATFGGRRQLVRGPIVTNRALEDTFDELVSTATERVVVASPYAVDRRLAALLEQAPAPDKHVIVTVENNFRYLQLITPYVIDRLSRAGAGLLTYRKFSHAKFVLADGRLLIGSSNFGRHSFWCNQEVGVVIDDPAFVEAFAATMLDDLVPLDPVTARHHRWIGSVASAAMIGYLWVYARLIVPRVPLLRTAPRERKPVGRLAARLGERAGGRRF